MVIAATPERAGIAGGLGFEFAFHVAAVTVHPQHHLQDQARGDQYHRQVEALQGFAGELALHGEVGEAKAERQRHARAGAGPESPFQHRGLRLARYPGQQHADDQHGFEAFAPDDDKGIEHGGLFRDQLHLSRFRVELVDEGVGAGLQRRRDDEGAGAGREHPFDPQVEILELDRSGPLVPDGEFDAPAGRYFDTLGRQPASPGHDFERWQLGGLGHCGPARPGAQRGGQYAADSRQTHVQNPILARRPSTAIVPPAPSPAGRRIHWRSGLNSRWLLTLKR